MYHEISADYAQNMLVCLPQDLHTFYVYWDFTGLRDQVIRNFLQRLKPECRLVIRLCRLDANRQDFIPERWVPLTQIAEGNYYFGNLSPLETYCCEIGAEKPEGDFICFYQTNPLRLQPLPEVLQSEQIDLDQPGTGRVQPQAIDEQLEQEEEERIAMSSWS